MYFNRTLLQKSLLIQIAAFVCFISPAIAQVQNSSIILLRHASAPGVGDPEQFRLGDCSTQRNLDDAGRAQARAMGDQLRQAKVNVGRLLSSQWCRTRETATLLDFGAPIDEPAFNSFFGSRQNELTQTEQAKLLLMQWRGPGTLVVVTHQVNITALTNLFVASGEGVELRVEAKKLKVIRRFSFK
jgi:phosphohistidine phosphatase SixA